MLPLFRLFRPQPESSFSSRSFALITLVGITACGELPDETRIEAPRILALRQEVTSSWLGLDEADKPPRAQAMPFETVTVSSYLATPTGELDLGTYLPVWLACELRPGEGLTGCISRERAKFANLASIPPCQPANLDAIDIENLPGESPLCRLAGTSTAQFEVPLTCNLLAGGCMEFSMIAAPRWPENTCQRPIYPWEISPSFLAIQIKAPSTTRSVGGTT